jgi:hypothetical protein
MVILFMLMSIGGYILEGGIVNLGSVDSIPEAAEERWVGKGLVISVCKVTDEVTEYGNGGQERPSTDHGKEVSERSS